MVLPYIIHRLFLRNLSFVVCLVSQQIIVATETHSIISIGVNNGFILVYSLTRLSLL